MAFLPGLGEPCCYRDRKRTKIARQPRGSRECRLGGHDVMAAPHTTIANFKRVMTGKGKPDVLAAINFLGLRGIFVEVGTFRGNFAEQICRFTQCEKLYYVDPYRSYDDFRDRINDLDLGAIFETTKKRLSPFGDRVSFLRDFSEKGADAFAAGILDLVYIDANHQREFVTGDLIAWYPKVRSGGLLCGDDVVDLAEDQRDNQGNVKIVWQRDEYGKPIAWGTYGVFAAVRDFAKQNELEYFISGT
jgi:hypothetical protein